METVITPTSVEQKTTAGGHPCVEIKYSDHGNNYTKKIFNDSMWNLFAVGLPVKITLEQKGQYWNIIDAQSVKEALAEKATTPNETPPGEQQAIPRAKPVLSATEGSKIVSMSLSYAKDMAVAGLIDKDEIMAWARFFKGYMLGRIKVKDTDKFRKILSSLDCELV